ncbi:MAG TPA: ribosome biogenesis GTP-binding protein YihA/YsxC [Candidatus Aminicenantes bacterium]|nr:ribosome biogenesis GTP-binding protein YihA/YsxC [Candidatus Aminicenantes bacterium]
MTVRQVELAATAFLPTQLLADGQAQIAVIGRSNVGKSTLLNRLLRRRMARSSSTPGKTLSVNYYRVNGSFHLVDLPGYGYARTSQEERERAEGLLQAYFAAENGPRLVLLLVDSRRGLGPADLEVLATLREKRIPVLTVLTKSDKLSLPELKNRLTQIEITHGIRVVPFSHHGETDGDAVWKRIAEIVRSDHVLTEDLAGHETRRIEKGGQGTQPRRKRNRR